MTLLQTELIPCLYQNNLYLRVKIQDVLMSSNAQKMKFPSSPVNLTFTAVPSVKQGCDVRLVLAGSRALLHSELRPGLQRPRAGHLWLRAGGGRRVHLQAHHQQRRHGPGVHHADCKCTRPGNTGVIDPKWFKVKKNSATGGEAEKKMAPCAICLVSLSLTVLTVRAASVCDTLQLWGASAQGGTMWSTAGEAHKAMVVSVSGPDVESPPLALWPDHMCLEFSICC